MIRIILPSAKLVPAELQDVGKLPAIIYPIGDECMLDILKKHYSSLYNDFSLEIVTFAEHNKVFERIKCDNHIRLHKVDAIRDVGYSVYCALKTLSISSDDSLIINYADTIVYDEPDCYDLHNDICFYSEEEISSRWTFFTDTNGSIGELFDKLPKTDIITSNKIMLGVFYISSPHYFLTCLEKAVSSKETSIDSLYIALKEYSSKVAIDFKKAQKWFDLGHLDKYYDMQIAVKSRTFNHISIDKSRGILTKTSDDIEKFIGEIKWYLKLPVQVEYCRPRIFSYSTSAVKPFVEMEYYSYLTLHEIFLYGAISDEQWTSIFKQIKFIISDFNKYNFTDVGIKDALKDMYLTKTTSRLNEYKKNNKLIDFSKPLIINGTKYKPMQEIMALLPSTIESLLFDCNTFQLIHGDLCFTNILVDPKFSFVKLIDPRGSFGKYDIYGDKRYELAKLMHSIDGLYDYIIKDQFEVNCDNNVIDYQVFENDKAKHVYSIFANVFKNDIENNILSIKLVESLLFFSMLPLHSESAKHQLAMLSTAITLFNEVEDIKESV